MASVESSVSSPIEPSPEQRRAWQTPVLKRLYATDAENAAGPTSDDPINLS